MLTSLLLDILTILGTLGIFGLVGVFFWDILQKKHTVLRNYPVVGHLRFFFEKQGEFFRQYFFMGDRDEMPFNRATRSWVYRLSKNVSDNVGFGSTYNLEEPGSLIFVNAPFAVLEEDREPTPSLTIGEGYCATPFVARSIVNISGMSYGSLSKPAISALSRGAKVAGCWMGTGEGGISPYHLAGDCDIMMQIGTAKYGFLDEHGKFSEKLLREYASMQNVRAFELKLSQGAKPGKGGLLPGVKVTAEIAKIRGIRVGQDSLSPNRHVDIKNMVDLVDYVRRIRDIASKPVGLKTALGGRVFLEQLCEEILKRGLDCAPDFLIIDGGEGGSGASPQALADHMGLSINEALPLAADQLIASGLKKRIALVASGRLITPTRAAWALCIGADFINIARGFLFALGCIQSMRCHTNTCPTGITTHNKYLQRGLVVNEKYVRVAHYAINMNKELDMIAHSCGVEHARELTREHVRIVQPSGVSASMEDMYPTPPVRPSSRVA